jgi:hypothetical protein
MQSVIQAATNGVSGTTATSERAEHLKNPAFLEYLRREAEETLHVASPEELALFAFGIEGLDAAIEAFKEDDFGEIYEEEMSDEEEDEFGSELGSEFRGEFDDEFEEFAEADEYGNMDNDEY